MSYPGDSGPANRLMPAAPAAKMTAPRAPSAGPQPPTGELGVPPAAGPGGDGMMDHMENAHSRQVAYYEKLKEAEGRTTVAREVLDSLVKMGDVVSQKDVVDGASKLVAAGLGAEAIAGMLADMPPDGPALQGWLAQQDAELRQRELQLDQATKMVRFQMGTNALRLLATHAMMGTHLPGGNALIGPAAAGPTGPAAPAVPAGAASAEESPANV